MRFLKGNLLGWLKRFSNRHFFDYDLRARFFWLLTVVVGGGSFVWSIRETLRQSVNHELFVLSSLVTVGLLSCLPVRLPRTKIAVALADIFIFTALSDLGVAAAVLAAGTEGFIGTFLASRRLTSRVATPSAHMAAMLVTGLAFSALKDQLRLIGFSVEIATLISIYIAALLQFAISGVILTTLVAIKNRAPIQPIQALADLGWVAAMTLTSAFLAGFIHLNARHYGSTVVIVVACVSIVVAWLLRRTFSQYEAERIQQEELITAAQSEAIIGEKRFRAAFTHAAIGMAVVDPDGIIIQSNQALSTLLAKPNDDLIGKPFVELMQASDAEIVRRQIRDVLKQPDAQIIMELNIRAGNGDDLWVSIHCGRFDDPGKVGQSLIFQLHDITSRHLAESRLHYFAYHDSLTDLANRSSFHARLSLAINRYRVEKSNPFAVIFLDLDRFKVVNDSLGHIAGNELLRSIAARLRENVFPSDLVARLGGDEFAILLESLKDSSDGVLLAERILCSIGQPLTINGTEVLPGASLGITFSDLGDRDVDEVLRDADLAMYEAKSAGRARIAVFDRSMHERIADKLALEADLRHAIGEGQISIQFQPMYDLTTQRLTGFEALARWMHPKRGAISPSVFIALAEESNRIEALTAWVIDDSVSKLARWHRVAPQYSQLNVHVNISGRDLARTDLASQVDAVLSRHAVPARRLTLEITETTLMSRLDVALQTLGKLRMTGVGISIDDFGTGYSSLAYLSTLPIDSLKIDRSFVMGLHSHPQNVEIVRAVADLGRSLGRKVIAEGIETAEQLMTLRGLGVPIGQGYLLSLPLNPEQVTNLLIAEAAVAA